MKRQQPYNYILFLLNSPSVLAVVHNEYKCVHDENVIEVYLKSVTSYYNYFHFLAKGITIIGA